MQLGKNILNSLPLILVSMLLGGVMVYGYYGFGSSTKTPKGISSEVSQTACSVASSQESLSEKSDVASAASAYLKFKEIRDSFSPTGVPDVYGKELNISFDEVQDAINKVQIFGPTYGEEGKKIVLTGGDLERYINIGSQTSCEYCCGVATLVEKNGDASCGCAHSIMMRGLAAYLIKNHPELSDEQILKELNTWKITYFPKQTLSAKLQEMEKTGETGIREILEEFPDFLPQMVGGC